MAGNTQAKRILPFLGAKYRSLWRFGVVGLVNTGLDFVLFLLLIRVAGVNYLVAQTASYGLGVCNSYLLNRGWSFEQTAGETGPARQFVRFVAVNIVSLGLSLLGLRMLHGDLGLNVYLAKVMVTALTWSVRYTGCKYWVFTGERTMKGSEVL